MATTAITTTSETKEWVLACGENEQCQLEVLKNNISFVESELQPPVDPKETLSMYLLENIPRDFQGDGTDSIWVFIDKKDIVRKRPYTPMRLHDANGNPLSSLNGALDIHDADVHSIAFNEFFHEHTGVDTTIAIAVTKDDISITVADATNINVGDTLQLENGEVEVTFPTVTIKVGNLLTLDRPLDKDFSIGDKVEVVSYEMKVNATLSSPRSFKIIPDGNELWHVISISISMVHSSTGDDSLFGDADALINGLVFRGHNGTLNKNRTNSNWKKNGDFGLDFGEISYTDKAGGGLHGTKATVSIKVRAGAIPSIDGSKGDYLEILVQDQLATLLGVNGSLRIKSQGHVVI